MIALGTSAAGHSRAVTVGQPETCAGEKNELPIPGHSTSSYLGLVVATCAFSSLAPALPFVARLLLLLLVLFPPPGPGPLFPSGRRSLHFLIKLFARPASDLSVVFFLSWFICFPSLVACNTLYSQLIQVGGAT